MHEEFGAIVEETQNVLSTQVSDRAFKKQDSECLSLKKKKVANVIRNVERHYKSLHQREKDKNNNTL